MGIVVDSTNSDLLDIPVPKVNIEKGVMTISGTVQRKPGVHEVIAGRLDIDIYASNGEQLDWLTALLTPNPVPDDQAGQSTYIVNYGFVPPSGSTVQVHFVDSATATQEDVDGREYAGGGYGGGGHAPSHGMGGGRHYGGHMGGSARMSLPHY